MSLYFLDPFTVGLLMHVFGAILGAGAAFFSDGMFLSSIKDGRMMPTELRFLRLGARYVWTGLFILVISGIFLVSLNPSYYLGSAKFLAKMTIVSVIVVNGLIFHFVHVPVLHRHAGVYFSTSQEFKKKSILILASGAVSVFSWISTVVLGMVKYVPYGYTTIMALYGGGVMCALLSALVVRKYIFHFQKTKDVAITDSVILG